MLAETLLSEPQVYRLAAGLVAAVALLVYLRAPTWLFGPQATFWNPVRRLVVPVLDRLAQRHLDELTDGEIDYAQYELDNAEYVGRVDTDAYTLGKALFAAGWRRMILAALKYLPDGRIERASWVLLDGWLARRQTHVMIFPTPAGETGVDVFAHEEPSALNPLTAWAHYTGQRYDPEAGVRTVRLWLDESAFEWEK